MLGGNRLFALALQNNEFAAQPIGGLLVRFHAVGGGREPFNVVHTALSKKSAGQGTDVGARRSDETGMVRSERVAEPHPTCRRVIRLSRDWPVCIRTICGKRNLAKLNPSTLDGSGGWLAAAESDPRRAASTPLPSPGSFFFAAQISGRRVTPRINGSWTTTAIWEEKMQTAILRLIFDQWPGVTAKATAGPKAVREVVAERLARAERIRIEEHANLAFQWVPRELVEGRAILDFGCDIGGRSVAWAEHLGAARLLGFDTSPDGIAAASSLAQTRGIPDSDFRVGVGEAVPFDNESVDVVLSNDVFEHVRNVAQCLQECARVLRPEGVVVLSFPPAYHPLESHLGHVTHPYLPLHLLFSARAIRAAHKDAVARRGLAVQPASQDWEWLPTLNGITVRAFRKIVTEQGWEIVKWEPTSYFQNRAPALGRVFRFFAQIPWIEEMLLHRISVVLRKPRSLLGGASRCASPRESMTEAMVV